MSRQVAVVETGVANLASVLAALKRSGAEPFLIRDPAVVEKTTFLVLPGVGAFGPAMNALTESGLVEPLKTRVEYDRPTLGICLGMQLLFQSSAEAPGVEGLGVAPATVEPLPPDVRTPHIGWNLIGGDSATLPPGHAYFAHRFAAMEEPDGWLASWTEHGGSFVSAIQRGTVLGCQFHPELSGDYGDRIIRSWLMEWTPW